MEREWRTGFPKHTYGIAGYYLLEVLLSDLFEDGKAIEAYFKERRWHQNNDGKEIPTERVVGWRETFTCKEAKIAIDEYVRRGGYGAITKDNFSQAWYRHLHMDSDEFVSCENCWNYYFERSGKKDEIPTPEKLLEIKQIAQSRQ